MAPTRGAFAICHPRERQAECQAGFDFDPRDCRPYPSLQTRQITAILRKLTQFYISFFMSPDLRRPHHRSYGSHLSHPILTCVNP